MLQNFFGRFKRDITESDASQSLTASCRKDVSKKQKKEQSTNPHQSLTLSVQFEIFPLRQEDFVDRLAAVHGVKCVTVDGELLRVFSGRFPSRAFKMELTQHAELVTGIVTWHMRPKDDVERIGEGLRIVKTALRDQVVDDFAMQVEEHRLLTMFCKVG